MLSLVLFASPALGQSQVEADAWGSNGYLGFSGLYQTSSSAFDEEASFDLNQEQGTLSAAHEIDPGFVYELSGGGRIYKLLGFGFAGTYFRSDNTAQVTASLPHPFFFEQPRSVSGEATDLEREEIGIHLDAMVLIPLTRQFQISVFGGPSFFRLKQAFVSGVLFDESYPYDEAQFTGVDATVSEWEWSRVGYNVGAEASLYFSKYVGIGASIRHSESEVEYERPGGPLEVKVGGTQVGGGLRVRF
jgi:hypothetical protein